MNSKTILSRLQEVKNKLYNDIDINSLLFLNSVKVEKLNEIKNKRENYLKRIFLISELINPLEYSKYILYLHDEIYLSILEIDGIKEFYIQLETTMGNSFGIKDPDILDIVAEDIIKYRVFSDFVKIVVEKIKKYKKENNKSLKVGNIVSALRWGFIEKARAFSDPKKNIPIQTLKFILRLGNFKISKFFSEIVGIGRKKEHPLIAKYLSVRTEITFDTLISYFLFLIVTNSYTTGITDKASVFSKVYSIINSIPKFFIKDVSEKIPNTDSVFESHNVRNVIENELYFLEYSRVFNTFYEIFYDEVENIDETFSKFYTGAPEHKIREVIKNVE